MGVDNSSAAEISADAGEEDGRTHNEGVDSQNTGRRDETDDRRAYFLQESALFNNRVVWYLEQQQKQEVFAIGASGALWAYLLQQKDAPLGIFFLFIPILISLVLAIKSILLTKSMSESMNYIYQIEKFYDLPKNMGWVHYYRITTSHYKRNWRRAFWTILVLGNVSLALVTMARISQLNANEKTATSVQSRPASSSANTTNSPVNAEVPNVRYQ